MSLQYLNGEVLAHAQSLVWKSDVPVVFMHATYESSNFYIVEAVVVLEKPLTSLDLGKNVDIILGGIDALQFFSGIIGKFKYEGSYDVKYGEPSLTQLSSYRVWLYPSLWKLGFEKKFCISQNLSKREILSKILSDAQIKFSSEFVIDAKNVCETNTQYHETTLRYVQRLMQEEGLFSYFDFLKGESVLVIAENTQNLSEVKLTFQETQVGEMDFEQISEIEVFEESFNKEVSLYEYDFKNADDIIYSNQSTESWVDSKKEIYPNSSANNEQAAKNAMNMLQIEETNAVKFKAQTTSYKASAGKKLEVLGHPVLNINGSYFIERSQHFIKEGETGWEYTCVLEGVKNSQNYIVPVKLKKPKIYGAQTAVVVGDEKNTEINVDKFGRIKVDFIWMRKQNDFEKSELKKQYSAWVRVAQWGNAGKGWGNYNFPRVGQEVIVNFLNADIDKPIVVGSVYNGINEMPHSMDDFASSLVMKTKTTGVMGESGSRYNELKMIDKEMAELVSLRAQKDAYFSILNDMLFKVDNDSLEVIKGSKVLSIPSDHKRIEKFGAFEVGSDDKISDLTNKIHMEGMGTLKDLAGGVCAIITADVLSHAVDFLSIDNGLKAVHIDKGIHVIIVSDGDAGVFVEKGSYNITGLSYNKILYGSSKSIIAGANFTKVTGDNTLNVTGDYNQEIQGAKSEDITGACEINVTGAYSLTTEGECSIEGTSVNITGTGDISLESAGMLSLKGSSISIDGAEINITGGTASITSAAALELTAGAAVSISAAIVQLG